MTEPPAAQPRPPGQVPAGPVPPDLLAAGGGAGRRRRTLVRAATLVAVVAGLAVAAGLRPDGVDDSLRTRASRSANPSGPAAGSPPAPSQSDEPSQRQSEWPESAQPFLAQLAVGPRRAYALLGRCLGTPADLTCYYRLSVSADQGKTWRRSALGVPPLAGRTAAVSLRLLTAGPGEVLSVVDADRDTAYVSGDGGETFARRRLGAGPAVDGVPPGLVPEASPCVGGRCPPAVVQVFEPATGRTRPLRSQPPVPDGSAFLLGSYPSRNHGAEDVGEIWWLGGPGSAAGWRWISRSSTSPRTATSAIGLADGRMLIDHGALVTTDGGLQLPVVPDEGEEQQVLPEEVQRGAGTAVWATTRASRPAVFVSLTGSPSDWQLRWIPAGA